ncbi:DUF2079 domain-containing protein [Planctomicrobium sp. SH664]|uniref:DUF2079 domain-containing protein n=1 Tax=Planctomicrobium sp. SH664 TaxID=3448125 RepID=UPI003F5C83E5
MPPTPSSRTTPGFLLGSFAGQILAVGLFLLFILENQFVAAAFVSEAGWSRLVLALGGTLHPTADGVVPEAPLLSVLLLAGALCAGANLVGAWFARRSRKVSFGEALAAVCQQNAVWSWPVALWSVGWIINLLHESAFLGQLLILTPSLALSLTLAAWGWTAFRPCLKESLPDGSTGGLSRRLLCAAMGAYVLIFVAMNWGLWFNLRLPHGDSSMYEEHLWNTLHGKGFRSYLDQGLFLGEHIQVIHLLLIPLYVLWPSHLLLELVESAAIALMAWPVYQLAKRFTGSERAGVLLGVASLFYFPSHYMDIAIDLKTFRPETLGLPALAFGLSFLEQRRWKAMIACCLLALSSKEDYAIVLAPLGLWLAVDALMQLRRSREPAPRRQLLLGSLLCIGSTLYLAFVVKVAIPWFRDGEQVHYVRYFQSFGNSPTEIVWNLLTRPQLLWVKLVTAGTIAYFLQLLVPLGFPWRGWSRLLVAAPMFVSLCLNELVQSTPGPVHHFHAPLIPILLWAACAALAKGERPAPDPLTIPKGKQQESQSPPSPALDRSCWILCCAITTAIFYSLSPFGLRFWDSGSGMFWKKLYVQDERARQFAKVLPLIPLTARVASTDFVHPRFTHCERSYDYSDYPRRVANYESRVPDDTDYIVLDTRHPYSKVKRLEDVRELQTEPERWEVLPNETNGYYIVLKKRPLPERSK